MMGAMLDDALRLLQTAIRASPDSRRALAVARSMLHSLSPTREMPVDLVRWVPLDHVSPNDYNPNTVARQEMALLYLSIKADGYTQPVVTIEASPDRYVIVDGFHRYYIMLHYPDIRELTGGLLPIVVLNKAPAELMASTVRHNRARGKHTIGGMSALVFRMLEAGASDAQVCNELGMSPEELLRLKHITGFSKLFADASYNQAWVTENQIRAVRQHREREERSSG